MAVHNVRFVTTAYTHMHENDYIGRPEDKFRAKEPDELTDVGRHVEGWREHRGLKVGEVVRLANEMLPGGQSVDAKDYWAFVRGQRRITDAQIRAIAKSLDTTVHIMTHYLPGYVPESEQSGLPEQMPTIRIHASAERAERRRKAKGTPKPRPVSAPEPYDADTAAKLLAERFGDRVKRAK